MDEKVVINILVELAGLESELVVARGLLARNKDRQGSLGELQEEYRQDAERAEQADKDSEVDFRNREGEIRQLESTLIDRRRRLESLTDARQVEAQRKEIDSLAERLDELETQALELLDVAQDTRREAETARVEYSEQEERSLRQKGSMVDQSAQAAAAEEELIAEIERLLGMLPEVESRHVRRLRQGLDQSVSFLVSGACGGCFSQLPTQQGLAVEKGAVLVRCPSCSRYIVHQAWH